jgi:hypothetical protein
MHCIARDTNLLASQDSMAPLHPALNRNGDRNFSGVGLRAKLRYRWRSLTEMRSAEVGHECRSDLR